MGAISRRQVIATSAAAAALLALPRPLAAQQRIVLNDASRLNPTRVARHWIATDDTETAFIERLRAELQEAATVKRAVAVGAARHSMGGQSLPRNGTAMTFDIATCVPDWTARAYRAHAGARWHQVIAALDPPGFSPAVMQSNSDFGVAATLSVNTHGWPVPYGPFGTTVRSCRLMLADGTILHCSRTENPELFSLVMGGYSLFGVILDLDVDMVENLLLKPTFEVMPSHAFAGRFIRAIDKDSAVQRAYGRLAVARQGFFEASLMVTYRPQPTPPGGLPPAPAGGLLSSVSRELYRAQTGSERAKRTRWFAETVVGPKAVAGVATRNTLMNEPVSNLASRDRWRTDILHEYFVPPERFNAFVQACQEVIPRSKLDLLNVTLRYVMADPTSVLAFAPTRRIAAVMSFSQAITPAAESDMQRMTEELIDRVIAFGGSFYLPYRLHARRDQVEKAYPGVARFIERKRCYDPNTLFRNAMWDAYFAT
jgi:FAD/FMN-containing dehydrogenase